MVFWVIIAHAYVYAHTLGMYIFDTDKVSKFFISEMIVFLPICVLPSFKK
jgi:hypothetical protein